MHFSMYFAILLANENYISRSFPSETSNASDVLKTLPHDQLDISSFTVESELVFDKFSVLILVWKVFENLRHSSWYIYYTYFCWSCAWRKRPLFCLSEKEFENIYKVTKKKNYSKSNEWLKWIQNGFKCWMFF